MSEPVIRRAQEDDLDALLAIYNHYVVNTAITFDLEPRTADGQRAWFARYAPAGRHQCFAAVLDGAPAGWACSGKFRERAAYDTTVETSIYLRPDLTRQGLGRKLYRALFDALKGEDVHRAVGVVTVPNAASVGLHEAMGFRLVGTFREVGRKFHRYWDVAWYEKEMP